MIALDCYGTMINFGDAQFIAVMSEICDQQGLAADASDMWHRFIRISKDARSDTFSQPFLTMKEIWTAQFHKLFRQMHLNGNVPEAIGHLKRRLAEADAFPETLPTVEALRPHYRLAVLSNADDDFLLPCLRRNRLQFKTIISSEKAKAAKPDPAIFRTISERLTTPPELILYVGDNPLVDIVGSRAAGLPVAWVNRSGMRRPRAVPSPDIMVSSLSQLLPMLAHTRAA